MILLCASAAAAQAATITVNSFEDRPDADLTDGVCDVDLVTPGLQSTLRAAVQHANVTPGEDTIAVPAGTYRLTIRNKAAEAQNLGDAAAGDLDLTETVTIAGTGASTTIIDCKKLKDRAFDVQFPASATISGLTIVNGRTAKGESGGAIRSTGIDVNISACVLSRCKASDDAGGFDLRGNTASLSDVWVDACSAKDDGGGIDVDDGTLTLARCTISKCKSKSEGGGLESSGGDVLMVDCTISGNKAKRNAGGISLEDGGTLSIQRCTVAYNKSKLGAGISVTDEANGANTCTVVNSIFAFNGKSNSDRALTSDGGNVDSGTTCGFELSNADPLLQALAASGGLTPTHALAVASPAANFGVAISCLGTDQRGVPRSVPCDSGSYEIVFAAK